MVGTTETLFQGDRAQCAATDAEIDYLPEVYKHYFPEERKIRDDLM